LRSPNSDRPCRHCGSEFCARADVVGNGAWPNKGEMAASVPVRRIERRVRRKGTSGKPGAESTEVIIMSLWLDRWLTKRR
jgi:hypothetical protein